MHEINKARSVRTKIALVTNYFLENKDVLNESGDSLEWYDLETLPEWYMWDESHFNHLVLIAGTVFLLPSIRLWIEVKKVNKIKSLIGKKTYEFIMQYTHVEHAPEKKLDVDDSHELIKSAGAAVILSSQNKRLHPWLTKKLPEPKGLIRRKVAIELMNHSLFVMIQTANAKEDSIHDDHNKESNIQ